ncbi:MAG: ATP-binding cassette domain-containing protein [Saprospiraceae bacterium]|nr:ATP-binding cassette domain-containing protein [Saprospiraceae bacterium]
MIKEIVNLKQANIYQKDKLILSNIDLKISKGEFVYLIGKTGSGKSSLLKTMYADIPLKSGKGEMVGYELASIKASQVPELRKKLGIVFQDFNLLMDRSIQQNMTFVLKATGWEDTTKMKKRISLVLELVGLDRTIASKMPHEISGGEQQRAVIARALLNKPEMIIADEPTGNLDPETSDDILKLFRDLSDLHNTSVLFATHDFRILENFPARIVRCHNGNLIEPEDLLS